MAIKVMIQGESGSGKSTSLRNFSDDEILYINVGNKPLPFRKKFETVVSDKASDIVAAMQKTKKKVIVLDDVQYVIANSYMRRSLEKGWDKFSEIAYDYFQILDAPDRLPDDVIVYYMSHTEVDENSGIEKAKTIGKSIDKYVTIEGKFTVVLKTAVADGTYNFITQNNGHDRVKSPIGMFDSFSIDNDLKYVDEKIRNYYFMEDAKTDDEIKELDEEKANDNVQPKERKRKSRVEVKTDEIPEEPKKRRGRPKKEPVSEVNEEVEEVVEEAPKRRRRRREEPESDTWEAINSDVPF